VIPDNATVPDRPDRRDLSERSVAALFALAIEQETHFGARDKWPQPAWYAYQELQYRGTAEVFEAACRALGADDPTVRGVGADVLAQLGYPQGGTFVAEAVDALVKRARDEEHPGVLEAIAFALGHRASPAGRDTLFSLARHTSPEIRYAVATGLWAVAIKSAAGDDDDPEVVAVHLELMRDPDPQVRNWATFGLGTQLTADTAEIRAALTDRLPDPDEETREEAVCGLANRRDEAAFQPLLEYLRSGSAGVGCIQAAEAWGDARFIDVLTRVRDPQPDVAPAAEAAIPDGSAPRGLT